MQAMASQKRALEINGGLAGGMRICLTLPSLLNKMNQELQSRNVPRQGRPHSVGARNTALMALDVALSSLR